MRRPVLGLTLIEVLAATILLSLIVVTCIPLLQYAAINSTINLNNTKKINRIGLADLADAIVQDPELFGITIPLEELTQPVTVNVSNVKGRFADLLHSRIKVELKRSSDQTVDHGWVVVRVAGIQTARWIPLKAEDSF